MRNDKTGFVQIYFGNGKGKTTAAVGQALRAVGNGLEVSFIQFLKKGTTSGEITILSHLAGMTVHSFGTGRFLTRETISDDDRRLVQDGLSYVKNLMLSQSIDMLILDEIGSIIDLGLVDTETLIAILASGNGWLDIVMTGHIFPESLLDYADLITEFRSLRHPYNAGIPARRGIEY